ncbi:MAG: CDP-glycerol glycerophosphotransferase family protein [Lachnospiraceae bacterium]|nr:CDP-glycerol glycerophosphotransferase family protein [Lachnospiraceae bacterium]
MIKKLGYYLFAAFFLIFRAFPLQKRKVFLVATHDDSEEGNIGIAVESFRKKMPELQFRYLTKKDGIRRPFSFFFVRAYHMATAGIILLDNIFMPMAYTPVSKKAKVVQLWHGTGTIKKFALDSDTGEVARLAEKANQRITHLIVNSEQTKKQYAGAFGVSEEKIYILGLPRTDLILDEHRMEEKKQEFFRQYPELQGKRCILYAPTFRDDEVEAPQLGLDLERFISAMGETEVLLLRLHPHVSGNFSDKMRERYNGRVCNMSDYPGVTTLLAVSDCLITDYSSIVFEYCLFDRPMVFYAYDLEVFDRQGRGFYEDYEDFVPGPVVKSQEELEKLWRGGGLSKEPAAAFREKVYEYRDRGATERLWELIFSK